MLLLLHRVPPALTARRAMHGEAYFALSEAVYRFCGVRHLRLTHGMSGKPLTADGSLQISLSHCAGLIACGVSGGGVPIGVDAEPMRTVRPGVAKRCFTPAELASLKLAKAPDLLFTRLWTLKESCVKATGVGLATPFRELPFVLTDDTVSFSGEDFSFDQLLTPDGFVVSICHGGGAGEVRRSKTKHAWESHLFGVGTEI